jgi:hypothetical protein
MMFNGNTVSDSPVEYFEDVKATSNPARYGVYVYDVTDEAKDAFLHGGNFEATADQGDDMTKGMFLLIVYEDESMPLIEYWIAEGAERMMADNTAGEEGYFSTGFSPEQCTANASFGGVDKAKVSKAELLTTLAFKSVYSPDKLVFGNEGDALVFNGEALDCPLIGSPPGGGAATSHWKYESETIQEKQRVALTWPSWVDINTTYLNSWDNLAEIQSKGNCIMAANAVLKVTYLPDLTVSLNVPSFAYGGETRSIRATIHNDGEAKAEKFYVKFSAVDGTWTTPTEHLIELLDGGEEKTVESTWRAPKHGGGILSERIQDTTVNISVEADWGNKVVELNESNNKNTKSVTVRLVKRDFAFSSGGPGNGTGPGEGEGGEAGAITGGSGKTTAGQKGGKAITGYLMKGTVPQSGAEGGGSGDERGEVSWVGLLLRLAMLAAAGALVGVGYLMERRRHNNKVSLEKKV